MDFFKFTNYRNAVRWSLERLQARGEATTLTELAKAARVQPPYLSKVLSGNADLSADQAYLVSERLKLNPEEAKYFRLLLEHEKAQLAERKKILWKKIQKIQASLTSPTEQRSAEQLSQDTEALAKYYLNPMMQIVHMHLLIPKWRARPEALVQHLNIKVERLAEILKTLEDLGIIALKGGKYTIIKKQLHLPKSSALCEPQQTLMKIAGAEHTRKLSADETFTFVATFSANAKAKHEIAHAFTEFLKQVETIVEKAPDEEVYQIQFDLFPWK